MSSLSCCFALIVIQLYQSKLFGQGWLRQQVTRTYKRLHKTAFDLNRFMQVLDWMRDLTSPQALTDTCRGGAVP
jgi:hypothetical protein